MSHDIFVMLALGFFGGFLGFVMVYGLMTDFNS